MKMKVGECIKITEIDIGKMRPINKDKLKIKRDYYYQNGYFRDEIILDEKNKLVDGYSTYLLAQEFGIKRVVFKRQGGKIFVKALAK